MAAGTSEPTPGTLSLLEELRQLVRQRADCDLDFSPRQTEGRVRLCLRKGRIEQAEYGDLRGNGGFMALLSLGAQFKREHNDTPVAREVTLGLDQAEKLLARLPGVQVSGNIGEERGLFEEAESAFFQFRRKEAANILIRLLRANRFHYRGWLLHGRLMARVKNIRKSLVEAKIWGNSDPVVQAEVKRIEPMLDGITETKRCLFCWSPLKPESSRCDFCGGLLRPTEVLGGVFRGSEVLRDSLESYEKIGGGGSTNARILYCLFLGHLSLQELPPARRVIDRAIELYPRETLFQQGLEFLEKQERMARPQPPAVDEKGEDRPEFDESGPVAALGGFPSEEPQVEEVEVRGDGKTVLIVEDSPTARKVVSMLLERKGYAIAEVETGKEALTTIDRIRPDLILLDVVLPDMSGYDALRRIRKYFGREEVPVVMLTSKNRPTDRMKGLGLGANEYLTKPFDPARLSETLEKYLGKIDGPPGRTRPVSENDFQARTGTVQDKAGKKSGGARTDHGPVSTPTPAAKAKKVTFQKPAVLSGDRAKHRTVKTGAVSGEGSGDRSILVVEDSPTARRVISMVLTKNGYQVLEAGSGREAMARLMEQSPSLILLDAMLPDTSGYDILTKLKQDDQWREVPVVMLTARKGAVDRQKGIQAGSVEYLTKPFDPQKLLGVIRTYVSA